MKKTIRNKGVASVEELRGLCLESCVNRVTCQKSVDVFGIDPGEIPGVTDFIGATSFLPVAQESDACLFV